MCFKCPNTILGSLYVWLLSALTTQHNTTQHHIMKYDSQPWQQMEKYSYFFNIILTKHAWLLHRREGEHLRNNQLTWAQDWRWGGRIQEGQEREGREATTQQTRRKGEIKLKNLSKQSRIQLERVKWETRSALEWLLRSARQDAQHYHLKSSLSVDKPLSPDLQGPVRVLACSNSTSWAAVRDRTGWQTGQERSGMRVQTYLRNTGPYLKHPAHSEQNRAWNAAERLM